MSWPDTTRRGADGVLEIGGIPATDLAHHFGTPLYVFDELTLRHRATEIRDIFATAYPETRVVYAGKAYLSPILVSILHEEGLGLDIVSGGELRAGLLAGVAPEEMVFHGNNKSRSELMDAVEHRVGVIAIDNDLEIDMLEAIASVARREVGVVLRLNPGVDPHTHAKMRTGATDSKFGFPVWDGQADRAATRLCESPWFHLIGYHAHVGSQIYEAELVAQTLRVMMAFGAEVRDRHGIAPRMLIPGGGFGVADDASGRDVSLANWADAAAQAIERACDDFALPRPTLVVEPGRSIIGPAGVALYEVGARKVIEGIRTYVSVDGGMADNIRPTLYGARYSAALANRDGDNGPHETVTIAGKYCESGDVLIENIRLPRLQTCDILAVPMAGAYCLAMASNYNLAPRPAAVLVRNGQARLIRRRETYDDVLAAELRPDGITDSVSLSGVKASL